MIDLTWLNILAPILTSAISSYVIFYIRSVQDRVFVTQKLNNLNSRQSEHIAQIDILVRNKDDQNNRLICLEKDLAHLTIQVTSNQEKYTTELKELKVILSQVSTSMNNLNATMIDLRSELKDLKR